ncbi:MAG: acyl-CoA thioesterase [Candidatus Amulumruptor caecigallinarius]|nr:acyl-CoA thioesterase [Candidatus Amulumruptor caecigallinarius]
MDAKILPPLSAFPHSVDVEIRFNDIDILGHLNNTVYFSFYDTGKAYFFQHIMHGKLDWRRVETVIANIDCCYISPIYFGERIEVRTRCKEIGEKSFRLQQVIVEKGSGQIKSACETVMVSFDPERKMSVLLPDRWRIALENSENDK